MPRGRPACAPGLLEYQKLEIALGLALIGLTLYTSTLSYALRGFSRGRLAAYLSEPAQKLWFERLDRCETDLQVAASFVRVLCIVSTIAFGYIELLDGGGGELEWSRFVVPSLVNLLVIIFIAIGIPHALAVHAGEAVLARSLGLLWILRALLFPVEKTFALIEFVVRRLLGKGDRSVEEEAERMEQEILDAVEEGKLLGAVAEEQREIIAAVFELHETHVSEIMTPRTEMIAIPVTASFAEARDTIVNAGHSRVPVYEDSIDQLIGVLYAKDLLKLDDNTEFDLRSMVRAVPFVPESKTCDQLLRQFRLETVHIAIVLDEYGGTAGLATIEDILEELVGEIDDEYDRAAPQEVEVVDADTLDIDARMHVDDLNEELHITIPENGDYDTVGGFVFSILGRIPASGDEIDHENLHITVLDAEPRRINRLRIHVDRQTAKGAPRDGNGGTPR